MSLTSPLIDQVLTVKFRSLSIISTSERLSRVPNKQSESGHLRALGTEKILALLRKFAADLVSPSPHSADIRTEVSP
jgi:hypothetical protein